MPYATKEVVKPSQNYVLTVVIVLLQSERDADEFSIT